MGYCMATIVKKEKLIEHPLEEAFDIEPYSTTVEVTAVEAAPVEDTVGYDDKDNCIEQKIEEVYAVAMGNVTAISDEMDRVEGKYKARVGEVAATMLNVALGAIREQRALKEHKDKLGVTAKNAGTPQTLNQNLIVADRNEILRTLMGNKTDK